ncbi:flavin reductase family protein [Methylobacterium brachythecii]|uniref:Flavin reductase n=1 Tax=Methylobacterium brachythecii TaxID=1176177 RepID=A0A7W6F7X3_9HYPH|nr:flavin reductase family protein [Methylobacterium brachythecii]MBB3903576.1 flavin reductase (DIM6/NTAB) family NADH-FMN oxidoreductase RutF [Methylobacterium brachythecii]GLS44072.1 flavin reductase [Methylobacterium brachythecii]
MTGPHVTIEPSILYLGTPVVLISTQNEDGTANLAPMSSAWWLGWRCMLGLQTASQTPQNMIRTGQCVLNLASPKQVDAVNKLTRLTGTASVPELKQRLGYVYEPAKFEAAGLTPVPSQTVAAPRVLECPIQLEAVVAARHDMMADDPQVAGLISAFEVRITRVHVHPSLLMDGHENRIDPLKWQPLIMNFQKLYGVSEIEVAPSSLAQIDERIYRMPDVDRARGEALEPSP